jgi:hypothetical protein
MELNPLEATGEYSRKAFNPLPCDGRDKSFCTLNAKYTLNFGFWNHLNLAGF